MFDLAGRRAVVTGAGGGLGTAICAALTEAGAQVTGCDIEGSEVSADEILRFDQRDPAEIATAAAAILDGGAPDILILNAGWTRAETLRTVTPEALEEELSGNFSGAARLSLHLLPAMRVRGGAIVIIASVNALSHFGNPAYAAAKASLLAWTRAIAAEEGPNAIRANAVIPASIRTNAWEARLAKDPDILTRLSRLYPLGRIVTPQEVTNAVLFLASPLASGITGSTLTVDAGLMAGNLPFLDALRSVDLETP